MKRLALAAALTGMALTAPAGADTSVAAVRASHPISTLEANGPDGCVYRFIFTAARGWRFAGRKREERKVEVASTVPMAVDPDAVQPGARFHDVPTGYDFAWAPERQWHLVGRSGRVR